MEEFVNGHCSDGQGTLTTDTGATVAEAVTVGFIVPQAVVAAAVAISLPEPARCGAAFDCTNEATNTQATPATTVGSTAADCCEAPPAASTSPTPPAPPTVAAQVPAAAVVAAEDDNTVVMYVVLAGTHTNHACKKRTAHWARAWPGSSVPI